MTRTENDPLYLGRNFPQIDWIDFPLIKFEPQKMEQKKVGEIKAQYDWLIFTSQNGVRSFFQNDDRSVGGKKIACVGSKTAHLVQQIGYRVDFIPTHFTSLELARQLPLKADESICYIGGNLSSTATIQLLRERTPHFLQLESYHTLHQEHSVQAWKSLFDKDLDVISFCSPSAVHSYLDQTKTYNLKASITTKFAAIGSTTAGAIKEVLDQTPIVASEHTFAAMINKIVTIL